MDNGILGLIGLARKAGKVEVGEEAVSIAARNHKARAIFFASDAAENTLRRRESLRNQGNCPSLILPVNKTELGGAVGRNTCALLALTDVGLAAAVLKKLPEGEYGDMAGRLERRAEKTYRRRKAQRDKAKAQARGKPWAPPPGEQKPS